MKSFVWEDLSEVEYTASVSKRNSDLRSSNEGTFAQKWEISRALRPFDVSHMKEHREFFISAEHELPFFIYQRYLWWSKDTKTNHKPGGHADTSFIREGGDMMNVYSM